MLLRHAATVLKHTLVFHLGRAIDPSRVRTSVDAAAAPAYVLASLYEIQSGRYTYLVLVREPACALTHGVRLMGASTGSSQFTAIHGYT